MSKPRIGITCSPLRVAGYYDAYLEAIASAGAEPVVIAPLPEGPDSAEAERILAGVDGLLMPGGWDVAPEEYGGEPVRDLVQVDHALDKTELALVRSAASSGHAGARDLPRPAAHQRRARRIPAAAHRRA